MRVVLLDQERVDLAQLARHEADVHIQHIHLFRIQKSVTRPIHIVTKSFNQGYFCRDSCD